MNDAIISNEVSSKEYALEGVKPIDSILFIDQYSSVGGGQKSLIALIRIAIEVAKEVNVLVPSGGDLGVLLSRTFGNAITQYSFKEIHLSAGRKSLRDFLIYHRFFFALMRRFRLIKGCDVVYVNGPRFFLPSFFLAKFLRSSFIFHVRIDHSSIEKRLIALIARSRRTHRVIANSPYILKQLRNSDRRLHVCRRLVCIENCLYPPFDGLSHRPIFLGPKGRFVAALIGRVSPEKGHQWLPEIAKSVPEMDFLIIGKYSDEHATFFSEIMSQCPCNVKYLGYSDNIIEIVTSNQVHFSIVPSLWEEPFGLVAIESMAMSCVTLMSRRGMLGEIGERTGGILFHSLEELIGQLHMLCQTPEQDLVAMSKQQFSKVNQLYGYRRFRTEIANVLRGVEP